MRIGILGGTFNPVHLGHLILAEYALDLLKLDKLIFVPVNIQPLKSRHRLLKARDRLAMLRIAIRANKKFSISNLEIKRGGKSYSVDTLFAFRKRYKGRDKELFFITGSDSLKDLARWRDLSSILKLVRFVVAERLKFRLERKYANLQFIKIPQIDISSSMIRSRLSARKSVRYLVPEKVLDYIKKRGLYR